jgi:hypothetical protein
LFSNPISMTCPRSFRVSWLACIDVQLMMR